LFQNPVGFGTSSWKNRSKPGFSFKSKEAVPKAEVLEQPQLYKFFAGERTMKTMKNKRNFLTGTILFTVLLAGMLAGCGGDDPGPGDNDWPSASEWQSYGIQGGLSIPAGASVAEVSEEGGTVDIVLTGVSQDDYENLKTQFQQKTGKNPIPVIYQGVTGCYFETEDFTYYLSYSTDQGVTAIGIEPEDGNPGPDPGPDPGGESSVWTWTRVSASGAAAFAEGANKAYIEDIIYGGGKFVAVGRSYDYEDESATIFYSADGASWQAAAGSGQQLSGIAYNGSNLYVAVGYSDIAGDYLTGMEVQGASRSVDGINWTIETYPYTSPRFSAGTQLNAVAYGAGKFVAVGDSNAMYYTTDGIDWTRVNDTGFTSTTVYGYPMAPWINDIAWDGSKFIAVANYGQMAQSPDGINWTAVSSSVFETGENGDHIVSIAANGSGTWVAGAYNGNIYYSSNNGISWSKKGDASSSDSKTGFSYDVNDVAYGGGKFVAVSGMAEAGYSTDGAAWTKSVPNPLYESLSTKGDFSCAAYGNGRFVAAGVDKNDVPAMIYTSGQ
jgi:hypothetical protein